MANSFWPICALLGPIVNVAPDRQTAGMTGFDIRPLTLDTWDAYAALITRNNGVWGGCWCMGFHSEGFAGATAPGGNRAAKLRRVAEGRAHAALVFQGEDCLGWSQYGPAGDLTRIKRAKAYQSEPNPRPDWRITCFFVDKSARRKGVSRAALDGALTLIAEAGGGLVESFPEDVTGRKVSSSFLHNGTLELFESLGFSRLRKLGKDHWLVNKHVQPGALLPIAKLLR
jgi:GNAT superfamily N-acetyltransferase